MERKNRGVDNEEYLGDALYCSLFPFFLKTVNFGFLKMVLFLRVNVGVME